MRSSFLETVSQAKAHLQEHGRVSLRALCREFALDGDALEELIEELVDIQHVAARDGKALAWVGATTPHVQDDQATLIAAAARGSEATTAADAEEWRDVIARYQQAAAGAVARFGGHVAKNLGDGLLIYFGWPTWPLPTIPYLGWNPVPQRPRPRRPDHREREAPLETPRAGHRDGRVVTRARSSPVVRLGPKAEEAAGNVCQDGAIRALLHDSGGPHPDLGQPVRFSFHLPGRSWYEASWRAQLDGARRMSQVLRS